MMGCANHGVVIDMNKSKVRVPWRPADSEAQQIPDEHPALPLVFFADWRMFLCTVELLTYEKARRIVCAEAIATATGRLARAGEVDSLVSDFQCSWGEFWNGSFRAEPGCAWPERDGMLAHDADAADHLAPRSRKLSDFLRVESRRAWAAFLSPEGVREHRLWRWWSDERGRSHFALALAMALWNEKEGARQKQQKKKTTAALPVGVLEPYWGAFQRKGRAIESVEHGLVHQPSRSVVAEVDQNRLRELKYPTCPPLLLEVLQRNAELTRGLTAQRLFRHLVWVGYDHVVENVHSPHRYLVMGGARELLRRINPQGSGSDHRAATELRRVLDALSVFSVKIPGGHDPLLMWGEQAATRGRKAWIKIIMGDPLLPNYVNTMPRSKRLQKEARRLVPVPLPEQLPPLCLSKDKWAAVCAMQLAMLEHMTVRAKEYADTGGVALSDRDWLDLADKSEISRLDVGAVRSGWLQPGEDGAPPFLVEDGGRVSLAPSYGRAEESIIATAHQAEKYRRRK